MTIVRTFKKKTISFDFATFFNSSTDVYMNGESKST